MSELRNIFQLLPELGKRTEVFETLFDNQHVRIERITSVDMQSDDCDWYDQDHDEWVMVLQGEGGLKFEDGSRVVMKPGDYLFIPAHHKHLLTHTSDNPPCIWLAIHIETA